MNIPLVQKIRSNSDYRCLFENFLSLSILQGLNYILPLVTFPYLVRVVGVEKFGLLSFATATIAYFQIITDYGFNLSATREVAIHRENKEKLQEIFSSVMIIKMGLLIVSLVLMSGLVFGFSKFRQDWPIYYLSFGMVLGQVLFPVWFFQGMERMRYITLLNILAKGLFTVAIFVFVRTQEDFWKVPLLNSIGFVIAGIVSLWLVYRYWAILVRPVSKASIVNQLREGWHIFVSTIFSSFYRNTNVVILGLFTTNELVGYYSISEKILKIVQSLQDVVGNTLFPYFNKQLKKDSQYFFRFNKKYFNIIIFIYLSLFLLLFISSKYIIFIIIGFYSSVAEWNMKILSPVVFLGGLSYYFGILGMLSMNYKQYFKKYIIITGIISILLCLMIIKIVPTLGGSITLLLSELILFCLIFIKIRNIEKYQ